MFSLRTDSNNTVVVTGVIYGVASEMQSISYGLNGPSYYTNETRQYNSRFQLTKISAPNANFAMTYYYPSGSNIGKINQQVNNITGETINYSYDSLSRLSSAAGSGWGNSYTYDGFGNLTQKNVTSGSAPALSVVVDGNTNHITSGGYGYDANGNLSGNSSYPPVYYNYDVENRMISTTSNNYTAGSYYGYDPSNHRVWQATYDSNGNITSQQAYFFGVDGQALATYTIGYTAGGSYGISNSSMNGSTAVRFAGRLIQTTDRVDSSSANFYPYGESRVGSTVDMFATYTQDTGSGLDYAINRYYSSTVGRFTSPDPYKNSAGVHTPQSWNRYAYAGGDPTNRIDGAGRDWCDVDECLISVGGSGDSAVGDLITYLAVLPGIIANQFQSSQDPLISCTPTQGNDGLQYWCLHNSGADYNSVKKNLKQLRKALKDDASCTKWLSTNLGKGGIDRVVSNLHFSLATSITTSTGTPLPTLAATEGAVYGSDIILNDQGSYFSSSQTGQFDLLIHELAHLVDAPDFIQNDATFNASGVQSAASVAAEKANEDLIKQNCGKTIGQ